MASTRGQVFVGEVAAPDVGQRHQQVTVLDPWPVAADDVDRRDRTDDPSRGLLFVEGTHQVSGQVFSGAEWAEQVTAQTRGLGWVGAEERGGAGLHLSVEDQVLDGDVVTAEAPGPRPVHVGFAKDS